MILMFIHLQALIIALYFSNWKYIGLSSTLLYLANENFPASFALPS